MMRMRITVVTDGIRVIVIPFAAYQAVVLPTTGTLCVVTPQVLPPAVGAIVGLLWALIGCHHLANGLAIVGTVVVDVVEF